MRKIDKLKNRFKCPFCGTERKIEENICNYSIADKWIQVTGCENEKCRDNPCSPEYGMYELWTGEINFDGSID